MSYSAENIEKANRLFAEKRLRAQNDALIRKNELYLKAPEIREIDEELSQIGPKIMKTALNGKDVDAKIKALREDSLHLRETRGGILKSLGYPAGYSDIKYECDACADTGYDGIKMCACMKRALAAFGAESSGLGSLLDSQSFETFSLSYYAGRDMQTAKSNFDALRAYADGFSGKSDRSWLLMGGTGLGKTHLSTSVAKVVIERGFSVVYDSAQNIFSDFESERFRNSNDENNSVTGRYFQCDLLIIDDLGVEAATQFTVSCLYNLINTRINRAKSTIVNTNLAQKDFLSRYTERITSRLFGEFKLLFFSGSDIRMQKLGR